MKLLLIVVLNLIVVFSFDVPVLSVKDLHSFQGCETPIPARPDIPTMYGEIRSKFLTQFKTQGNLFYRLKANS
jgi:hypothetical protein